jgi:hypothetical protein
MAILQGARITGSIIATEFIKASGFSGSLTASNLYVLGKAGIGTTSPTAKLEIAGFSTGAGLKLNYGNSSGTIEAVNFIANGGANGVIGMQMVSAGVGDLWLGGSGGRTLTLYRDGNVGIGTTSPSNTKLHIVGDWVSGHSTVKSQTITSFSSGGTAGYGTYDSDGTRWGYLYSYSTGTSVGSSNDSPLILETNGTEKVRITSGGNVGIGITSPTVPLAVQCNTGGTGIIIRGRADNTTALRFYANNGTTQQLYIGTDDSNIDFVSVSTRPIRFFVNDLLQYQISQLGVFSWKDGAGGDRMTLNSTGLGVGASPTSKLYVYGANVSTIGQFRIDCPAAGTAQQTFAINGSYQGQLYVDGTQFVIGSTTSTPLVLRTANIGALTIDASQNVGVGVTPTAIFGASGINGKGLQGDSWTISSLQGTDESYFGNNLYSSAYNVWSNRVNAASGAYYITGGTHIFLRGAAQAAGTITPTESMRITSTGAVGIGTTNPNTKLQVSGSVSIGGYNAVYSGTNVSSLNITAISYPVLAFYYGTTLAGTTTANSLGLTLNAPASKYISFEPGDSEKMRITSAGNVGIGTTSPSQKLTINNGSSTGAGAVYPIRLSGGTMTSVGDSTGLLFIQRDANDDYGAYIRLYTTQANPQYLNPRLEFGVQTTDTNVLGSVVTRMVITGDGDVGIGTTSPTAQSNYRFLQVNGTNSAVIETMVGGSRIGGFDSSASALYVGSIGSYPVIFRTAVAEKMRIATDGNVGIGTSSPAELLDIAASADNSAVAGPKVNFKKGSVTKAAIGIGGNYLGQSTNTNDLIFRNDDGNILFGFSGAEKMRITSGGYVGIGTSTTTSGLQIQTEGTNTTSGSFLFVRSTNASFGGGAIGVGYQFAAPVGNNYYPFRIRAGTTNAIFLVNSAGVVYAGDTTGAVAYGNHDPYYAFNQDTNTGMDWAAADTLTFKTGGTERMRITSVGNVGIGTTSPSATLTVITSNNTGSRIQLGTVSTSTFMDANKVNDFMVLTAPFGNNPASVSNAGAKWGIKMNGSIDNINTKGKAACIYAVSEDGAGFNRTVGMALHTSGFDLDSTERVRINSSGNVGIGTTSPVNKLHVSGSSTNLPLKLEGLTSNATGYFLTVDNTTGVVYKSTGGANGTSGTSGANGSPGSPGSSGTNGTSGTSGANGNPGTSGTSGANGNAGSSGITGTSGTSGDTNIKAWIHFNGTGTPSSNASNNVSSITDNGTGDYTINFTTAFSNANYVVAGTATYQYENPGQSINNMFIAVPRRPTAQLAGSCRISTPGSDNVLYDCDYVRVLFSN